MADAKTPSPPYVSFGPFLSFLDRLKETDVPGRIDASVFGNASGTFKYSALAALKTLGLIDEEGTSSEKLQALVDADDNSRKAMFAELLQQTYPDFWNGTIDLKKMTAAQFDEYIRQTYDVRGSTVDKIAAFFMSAADFAEVPISSHLKARKATASSSSSKRSSRPRRKKDDDKPLPPAPPPAAPARKPLEYELVDLLSDKDIQEQHQDAIWTLVRFLTEKKSGLPTKEGQP
ncbi:DUF5343 domain-containing protein [Pyruvatibacter mobilis]|uniref:DUF5343 domain-containing protein n=1 Tax=Pyruvatibacter mobilis TaxID=1712261 RepID=UPI003D12115A